MSGTRQPAVIRILLRKLRFYAGIFYDKKPFLNNVATIKLFL